MFDFLLSRGADVLARNKVNVLPIAFSSSVEIFQKFVQVMRAEDPNSVPRLNAPMSSTGLTLFQLLVVSKAFSVVEWLMQAGFCGEMPQLYNFADPHNDTLKLAIMAGAPETILAPLHAALPADYSFDAFKLLLLACAYGKGEGVRYFAQFVANFEEEFGDERITLLFAATSNLNYSSAEALLDLGANPNRLCGKKCCSVVSSTFSAKGSNEQKLSMLTLLAARGATFQESFKGGHNLLSLALTESLGAELFEFLASKVAPETLKASARGEKLIHLAAAKKSDIFLKILFKLAPHSPDEVNERNSQGLAPLHIAASANCRDACMFLLSNGADPNLKTKFDDRPSQRARGFPELANELRQFEADESICC